MSNRYRQHTVFLDLLHHHIAVALRRHRDLAQDLDLIAAWGASAVVTLVEPAELLMLKVPHLGEAVHAKGMTWHHLPIADYSVPDEGFERIWQTQGRELRARLCHGENILLHCKGGLGRTGTVAACLLREAGIGAADAVAQVRLVRPKTIETTQQERYVQAYRRRFGGGL